MSFAWAPLSVRVAWVQKVLSNCGHIIRFFEIPRALSAGRDSVSPARMNRTGFLGDPLA